MNNIKKNILKTISYYILTAICALILAPVITFGIIICLCTLLPIILVLLPIAVFAVIWIILMIHLDDPERENY